MPNHAETIRRHLTTQVANAAQLAEKAGVSQPTLSRALQAMGSEILRFGAGKSIHYALRDTLRGLADIPVYRVDHEGALHEQGVLVAVRPEGFVMCAADGRNTHSDGLPWWLYDMRPQGYLGRAWARQHAAAFGLPAQIHLWQDHQALRALLAGGLDCSGHFLLGADNRARFLAEPLPEALTEAKKTAAYPQLAEQAASGAIAGSSAGGEQPKFTVYAQSNGAAAHLIVKFSEKEDSPVSERWRDLLLAEHLALQTLKDNGISAAQSALVEAEGQRFLETMRFDRVGARGRIGLHSLTALDLQFAGKAAEGWPGITRRLAHDNIIDRASAQQAALLWAFGHLTGNSDMHGGNLSFINEQGFPLRLAPVYDMTPMAFAPRSGGGLPEQLPAPDLRADIPPVQWRQALELANEWFGRVQNEPRFSPRFAPCIAALHAHLNHAASQITRLAP